MKQNQPTRSRSLRGLLVLALTLGCLAAPLAQAQFAPGPPPPPPKPAREAAPIDLTGYWVALVTEDWRFRMITAPKGDHPDVPLNVAGNKLAAAWDPAADAASGNASKAYGGAAIMRMPARVHIQWADASTLKVDVDAGQQTRLFHFAGGADLPLTLTLAVAEPPASLQGNSLARWVTLPRQPGGALKVITTRLAPGYLQRNGVPYSDNAVVTEYFDVLNEPNGVQLLVVQTFVEDPTYLQRAYITSSHFRRQADGTGWNPKALRFALGKLCAGDRLPEFWRVKAANPHLRCPSNLKIRPVQKFPRRAGASRATG